MALVTPEELLKYPPPKPPAWITSPRIMRYPLPCPEYQVQILGAPTKSGKPGVPYWTSNPGPQTWALLAPFDELVVGGSRGGGKSCVLISWFAMGDQRLDPADPAHYSYLLEPSYRGLMLRKEYQSMAEFVDEASDFFGPLGGKKKNEPTEFHFKSGAIIYTNHLGDAKAFEKYRGWGISRIGIEELTQIEEERWYLKLLGSLRAKKQIRVHAGKEFAALRSQIMSTTNPDGPGKCVPYGDVLTPSGWRDIKGIQVGDVVWSIDPADGRMIEKVVEQTHSSHYEGEMYEADGRGLSMACTPNHKVLRFNTTKKVRNALRLQAIEDFPGQAVVLRTSLRWDGVGPDRVVLKRSGRRVRQEQVIQPLDLAICDFAALVGWMVSEGSSVRRDNAINISQVKESGREKLRALLDRCGFVQSWSDRSVTIYSHEWLDAFAWLPHCYGMYVPQWIKNLPTPALESLMEAMIAGDGHAASDKSGGYYTVSPRLAADFCEIAIKCGYMVLAGQRDRSAEITHIRGVKLNRVAMAHEVQYHKQALCGSELRTGNHKYDVQTSTKRLNVKKKAFSGNVYCIGVPDTHTFIIRQNGCVWVSGNSWVKKRFVKVLDSKGNIIPTNTPMKDKITGLSRIFIPMSRMDNVYLRNDKQYEGMLLAQDEVTRKQWIDGDWDAGSGQYFSEFRPQGPLGPIEQEKYPWARHVVPPVDLQPWWYRFGGGDWGYSHPAAFHKFCRSERDGRINVYDEMVLRGCGSFEMGVRLAHWWMPDLEGLPNKSVTIAFSPDAFATTDSGKTKVEQMADGIASVLGPYGAFLLKYTDDERRAMESNPANAQRMTEARIASAAQGKMQIVLKRASTDTVARWSYVRELLRFRPIVQETEQELRERVTERFQRSGLEAYERELLKIRRPQDEHLPKLHIWKDRCPGLVRCLEEAMEDETNSEKVAKKDAVDGVGGDDPLDSACHGLHHFKEIEKVMPKSYFVSERMEQIQAGFERDFGERLTDPNRLIMIQQTQSARYDNAHPSQSGGFTPARMSSGRHRKPN